LNKLAIPAILLATVMVAGIFAFMPVEQASTVHGDITGSQIQFAHDDFDASEIAIVNGMEIEITATTAFCIDEISIELANLDANDDLQTSEVELNNIDFTDNGFDRGVILVPLEGDDFDGTDSAVTFMRQIQLESGELNVYCGQANDIFDFVLVDGSENGGDLIAGEVVSIDVWATLAGDGTLTVVLEDAD